MDGCGKEGRRTTREEEQRKEKNIEARFVSFETESFIQGISSFSRFLSFLFYFVAVYLLLFILLFVFCN
jgi:hypothetical protein